MGISHQIEAVYQRALQLRERAITTPVDSSLLDLALKDLYLVLEELQAVDAELHQQNQRLSHAHQDLDRERQRYRTLFELAPDGYLVTDETGKIYHANRAAATLFGQPQAGLVGKPLIVLIEPEDWSDFQRRLAQPDPTTPWNVTLKSRRQEPVRVAIAIAVLQDSRPNSQQSATLLWSLRDRSAEGHPEPSAPMAAADVEALIAARTAELVQANAQLRQDLHDCRQGRMQ